MNDRNGEPAKRPRWVLELGPDELTRARLKRSVADAARPLLQARRITWWEVASSWASLLIPVAASIALLIAGLAIGDRPASRTASTVVFSSDTLGYEEFVDWASAEELPRPFPGDSLADLDVVLTAITTER
ncbi:MAG: hypothetical protein M8858_01685 [marine benthic group bacterium]|nr:hypothetical protein [Gemmatimonadota bacterium]